MIERIKRLCAVHGISGDEARVRDQIILELGDACRLTVDNLGNLIAVKPGKILLKKIALFAHMDEVGLMVTRVTDEGLLQFSSIGIDPRALYGRRFEVGEKCIPGAVGAIAWHHLEETDRNADLKADGCFLDIGAQNREEAEAVISPGDGATFDAPFTALGDD
ncbi:MAG: M42 family peptidase, partial [Oscillospiraceae bacterium]